MGYKEPVSYRRNDDTKGGGVATFIKMGLDSEEIKYSPFLHYPLVPSFKKINIGNTGNQNPPEGGFWLPVFPILIFVSR